MQAAINTTHTMKQLSGILAWIIKLELQVDLRVRVKDSAACTFLAVWQEEGGLLHHVGFH